MMWMSLPPVCSAPPLQEVVVSVGPDGRVYFHDLDRELIEVALAINPQDEAMLRRLEICKQQAQAEEGLSDGC
jgi:hypothetical protein